MPHDESKDGQNAGAFCSKLGVVWNRLLIFFYSLHLVDSWAQLQSEFNSPSSIQLLVAAPKSFGGRANGARGKLECTRFKLQSLCGGEVCTWEFWELSLSPYSSFIIFHIKSFINIMSMGDLFVIVGPSGTTSGLPVTQQYNEWDGASNHSKGFEVTSPQCSGPADDGESPSETGTEPAPAARKLTVQ